MLRTEVNLTVFGAMRVKNESRWIQRSIESLWPLCSEIFVLDDNSTDDTADLVKATPRTRLYLSPFTGTDEVRDKNYLLGLIDREIGRRTSVSQPVWIVMIDGDEVLMDGGSQMMRKAMSSPDLKTITLPVWYLWDSEDHRRVDGVYGQFARESCFRYQGERFHRTSAGANFHCGNVPQVLSRKSRILVPSPLLHYGYMHREDRVRKYGWYTIMDPGNAREDGYRHMVIGDLFPAESKFQYGGPLKLASVR